MRTQILLTTAAILMSAPLAACATEGDYHAPAAAGYGAAYGGATTAVIADDGLLPEPPANARAGQCFAKVVVPGQPVYGPPSLQSHMRWVQTPPQPGTIGPVWCQVWEQGYQPTVSYTPERYGWIRVICDKDATRDKIGHIQHRLHDWGYYQGGYDGQYDAATAEAVKRFQSERHVEHGGYLSYKTMEMLDAAPPAPVAPAMTYAQGYVGGGYALQQQQAFVAPPVYQQPVYPQQAYAPPPIAYAPQPVFAPQPPMPCGPAPCQGGGYPQASYGQAAYGQGVPGRGYSVQRQWLSWSGKSGY
jgi:hypothetical protein